jgi:uncharacterized membrane protein
MKSSDPKMKTPIQRTFLTGLVILTPVLVAIWVVELILAQISGTVTPLVRKLITAIGMGGGGFESFFVTYLAPIVSIILAGVLIYALGLLGGNVIGRQLLQGLERLMMNIPFVRGIYSATRQFLETFSRDGSQAFRHVVLFEYPRKGLWTMGLLTNDTKGEVGDKTPEDMVSVFVPTTPNPTSGWLIFVPKTHLTILEMSVDDAFKMIISGGVLTPPSPKPASTPGESSKAEVA